MKRVSHLFIYKYPKSDEKHFGFTIVELLVVIVVIGILASISLVAYTGTTQLAKEASIKSDLSNASKQLQLFYAEHGTYPISLDINNCPVDPVNTNYCIKSTSGNVYTYSSSGNDTFVLGATNGPTTYRISNNSTPTEVNMTKIRLTVDHTKVAVDQSSFPIYIDLSLMPSEFWNSVSDNGGDIRIYKADQITELPREIVSINNISDIGEVWFKGDVSSTQDTVFYVYCGTGYVDYAVSAIYGARNVWDSSARVFHLKDASSTTVSDSGLNNYVGYKSVSNTPLELNVYIGKGQGLDGVSNIGTISIDQAALDTSQPHTYVAWVKVDSTPDSNSNGIIDKFQMQTGSFSMGTRLHINTSRYLSLESGYTLSGGHLSQSLSSDSPLSIGVYYFVAGVYDGTNLKLFVNDISKSVVKTASPINRTATNLRIGNTHHSNGTLHGVVDEARIYQQALSNEALSTMYFNQSSPATFMSSVYVD